MGIVWALYFFFLTAMALPQIGFWSKTLPGLAINIASWGAVGLAVTATLLLWLYPREKNDIFLVHSRRLQGILVMMAIGGLVDVMRYLIFYEQFRLPYNFSAILYYVLMVLWIIVFVMIVHGIYDLWMYWRFRGKSSAAG